MFYVQPTAKVIRKIQPKNGETWVQNPEALVYKGSSFTSVPQEFVCVP